MKDAATEVTAPTGSRKFSMESEGLDTHQKAIRINRDSEKYGTFAEIGAGQEVARWFFRVGGAAGTVAKTISAYDMTFSDAIYGEAKRYVSRSRLEAMLDHEYGLLYERLKDKRSASSRFFAFADTVAASSYSRKGIGHGWMGIRYLLQPEAEPSQIIIHTRLLDRENLAQQEALGSLGVNLIYGAFYHHQDPGYLLGTLLDELSGRVEVDMVEFSGLAFRNVDNRLMSLQLVTRGLTHAAMVSAQGKVVQPADMLYKKHVLVEKGHFRPVTKATLDMLECAERAFRKVPDVTGDNTLVLTEMNLTELFEEGDIDYQDFLDRVDLLGALGKSVLISAYLRYFRLAGYLFQYTNLRTGFVMGVPSLRELFDERFYDDLGGGLLESFGRLFKNGLKLFVYPYRSPETGELTTAQSLDVPDHLKHLHAHLIENGAIEDLRDYNEEYLPIFPRDVLSKIRTGDPSWEEMVPETVAKIIKERRLFSYAPASRT